MRSFYHVYHSQKVQLHTVCIREIRIWLDTNFTLKVSGMINYVFRNGGMLKRQVVYAILLEALYIEPIFLLMGN